MEQTVPTVILRKVLPIARRGIVFAGHGVARNFVNCRTEEVHISFDCFRRIVNLLELLDFDFLTMDEVVELTVSAGVYPKHWVHLSFDDGYQNVFDTIYPFLKNREHPFSLFVSTHYVETGERFPTFWLRLAEELGISLVGLFPEYSLTADTAEALFECAVHFASLDETLRIVSVVRDAILRTHGPAVVEKYYNDCPINLANLRTMAADPLVHIGSHSHHHLIFHPGQDPSVARENIEKSISLLREEWKVSDRPTFCFPNGDWAPQWVKLLRDSGVAAAFPYVTGFVDRNVEPMLLPRFWLSDERRALAISLMSVLGNSGLPLLGRAKPPRRNVV